MAKYQKFHIYRRKNSKGKYVHSVRFLDPETGKTLRTLSTGTGNRTAAVRWAESKLPEIEAEMATVFHREIPTVREYAGEFFTEGGPYERRRTERGYDVAKVYLRTCASYTKNHIIPTWGGYRLNEITTEVIDRDIIAMFQAGKVASASVNKTLKIFRLILAGAGEDGFIQENPASRVKRVRASKKERGVFTRQEIFNLFHDPTIWPDFRHYTIGLVAFTTGMRLGEIRGLCLENVHDNYIGVQLQWEDRHGLKPPKANSVRDIAIPPVTSEALGSLIWRTAPDRLIFYSLEDKGKPLTSTHVADVFYKTLAVIGIDEEERRRRNLVFHSFRHSLNTILRSNGIADAKIQAITGHRSDEMTANYTHFDADDYRDISSLTASVLRIPAPGGNE